MDTIREILSGLGERLRELLYLIGDFITYIIEKIQSDKRARIIACAVLAAVILLAVGSVLLTRSRNTPRQQKDLPTEEITYEPVVEEAAVTPVPVRETAAAAQEAGAEPEAAGEETAKTDTQESAALEPAALEPEQTGDEAGSGADTAQARPAASYTRQVDSAAVTSSGSVRQINEYVAKNGASDGASFDSGTDTENTRAEGEEGSGESGEESGDYEEGEDSYDYDEDYYEEDYYEEDYYEEDYE